MSKGQFIFEEYETSSGIYVITLNNFRYHNYFSENVQRILKRFLTDDKLFFGFYRTDGLNISNKCQEVIKNEIPLFFRKNGCINYLNEYLSTAEIIATDRVFDYIPFIFDYFLETIIFKPNMTADIYVDNQEIIADGVGKLKEYMDDVVPKKPVDFDDNERVFDYSDFDVTAAFDSLTL